MQALTSERDPARSARCCERSAKERRPTYRADSGPFNGDGRRFTSSEQAPDRDPGKASERDLKCGGPSAIGGRSHRKVVPFLSIRTAIGSNDQANKAAYREAGSNAQRRTGRGFAGTGTTLLRLIVNAALSNRSRPFSGSPRSTTRRAGFARRTREVLRLHFRS